MTSPPPFVALSTGVATAPHSGSYGADAPPVSSHVAMRARAGGRLKQGVAGCGGCQSAQTRAPGSATDPARVEGSWERRRRHSRQDGAGFALLPSFAVHENGRYVKLAKRRDLGPAAAASPSTRPAPDSPRPTRLSTGFSTRLHKRPWKC